jgi:hypothetical protein
MFYVGNFLSSLRSGIFPITCWGISNTMDKCPSARAAFMKNMRTGNRLYNVTSTLALLILTFYAGIELAFAENALPSGKNLEKSKKGGTSSQSSSNLKWKLSKSRFNAKKYFIEVTYPVFSGTASGIANANASIAKTVATIISQEKQNLSIESGSCVTDPAVILATPDLISVSIIGTHFVEGAAHPSHFMKTINYQLKPPKQLTLEQLFKPDSHYLQSLSGLTRAKLKVTLGDAMDEASVKNGTAPTKENFNHFLVKKGSLTIPLDDYQIGPYSQGMQNVDIPWEELDSILAPGTSVYKLAHKN